MNNISKTESIKKFLTASTLIDLSSLYTSDMECQVNAAQDGGTPTDGTYQGREWRGWTDGIQTWKTFRIPYNAATEPDFDDKPMTWDLAAHAEGIGMTGWDWTNRCSKWVAFDFDAVIGHSERHTKKLTQEELDEIKKVVSDIEWVTLRKSTSGKGLHIYVFVDNIPTSNHTEHAALARSILGKLAAKTGHDLQSKVDACGGNMWVWHRKMRGTEGLQIIKQGTSLSSDELPLNWRDHISVVSGKTKRVKRFNPSVTDEVTGEDDLFNELIGKSKRSALDDKHRKLLDWLDEMNFYWEWDNDHGILITHTWYLQKACDDLGMAGIFKTEAKGAEARTDYNCFAFPIANGAWVVRRYSQGVGEHPSWHQDGNGWTRTYLNREADIDTAARSQEGVENPSGGYSFTHASMALATAKILGANIDLPAEAASRTARIREHKDGRLIFEIDHLSHDNGANFKNWLDSKGKWTRIFNIKTPPNTESEIENYDDRVRHVITSTNTDYGWTLSSSNGLWRDEPLIHVKLSLEANNLDHNQVKQVLGTCVITPWILVNKPFEVEYPGNRQWNRNAVQLRFSKKDDVSSLAYPHWAKVFKHIGQGLDSSIKLNPWCKVNGILTGEDYLYCWAASLLQEPGQPLPYLFLWSMQQNTGKSILHEALSKLVTKGVQRADSALVSSSNFNGELEGAILCIVEETDLKGNKKAYDKIKDWVTSLDLLIHPKTRTPFTVPNTTHWIQCANSYENCPVFPGDSRITMIQVSPLSPIELIPKKELLIRLESEARDFITMLLNLTLPPSNDRLNVPVIVTEDKKIAQQMNRTQLEEFLDTECYAIEGEVTMFSDFYDAFVGWLQSDEIYKWGKQKVSRSFPLHFPKGNMPSRTNQVGIGNLSLKPTEVVHPHKWILSDGNLISVSKS